MLKMSAKSFIPFFVTVWLFAVCLAGPCRRCSDYYSETTSPCSTFIRSIQRRPVPCSYCRCGCGGGWGLGSYGGCRRCLGDNECLANYVCLGGFGGHGCCGGLSSYGDLEW